jgi:branched-chain amino acid transport system substrate-binding protein
MRQLHLLYMVFAFVSLFALAGCGGGGGGYNRTWENTQSAPAEAAPGPLGTVTGPQAPTETAQPATPAANLPTVKVALLLPLSGKHEGLGQAMLDAAQIALFDVGHASFELMPQDTGGTADGAANAARTALKEGAQLILGPVFAEEVRAVKSITSGANINVIGFSTDWALAGGNTFIMGFLPFDQIERVVTYAAAHNVQRVGVLAPSTEYGRAVLSAYDTLAPRLNIQTTARVSLPASVSAMDQTVRSFSKFDERAAMGTAQVGGIQPAPFDAVLMPVGGETAQAVSTMLNTYNLPSTSVRRLGTGLFDDPALAADRNLNGAWFAAPSPRLRASFEKRFQSTYSYAPPRLATLAYDATALASVLAQRGLQTGGRPSFDRAAIANANGFAGIDGIFRFRPNGTAERGLAVLEFSNGQVRILEEAPRTFQQQTQ